MIIHIEHGAYTMRIKADENIPLTKEERSILAERVKYYRINYGYTQAELEKEIQRLSSGKEKSKNSNRPGVMIQKIENAKYKGIPKERLRILARVLQVEPNTLIGKSINVDHNKISEQYPSETLPQARNTANGLLFRNVTLTRDLSYMSKYMNDEFIKICTSLIHSYTEMHQLAIDYPNTDSEEAKKIDIQLLKDSFTTRFIDKMTEDDFQNQINFLKQKHEKQIASIKTQCKSIIQLFFDLQIYSKCAIDSIENLIKKAPNIATPEATVSIETVNELNQAKQLQNEIFLLSEISLGKHNSKITIFEIADITKVLETEAVKHKVKLNYIDNHINKIQGYYEEFLFINKEILSSIIPYLHKEKEINFTVKPISPQKRIKIIFHFISSSLNKQKWEKPFFELATQEDTITGMRSHIAKYTSQKMIDSINGSRLSIIKKGSSISISYTIPQELTSHKCPPHQEHLSDTLT